MRCTEHAFYFVAPLFGKVALSFTPEQVGFLHALKGAPAGLLLVLLLADRPLAVEELLLLSGYSAKTVHKGLQMLQAMALVRPGGIPHTWTPARSFASLYALFRPAQPGGETQGGDVDEAHGASTGREPAAEKDFSRSSGTYTSTTTTSDPVGEEVVASKYDRPGREKFAKKGQTVDNSPISVDNQGDSVDNYGDMAVENAAEVRAWLERAGIGRNSPKMRTLLARRLDPYVVRAFVLDREYQLREGRGRGVNAALVYRPGLLIKKLEDGDPPPPMRCEDCLAVLPCYCGIVRR